MERFRGRRSRLRSSAAILRSKKRQQERGRPTVFRARGTHEKDFITAANTEAVSEHLANSKNKLSDEEEQRRH